MTSYRTCDRDRCKVSFPVERRSRKFFCSRACQVAQYRADHS